MDKIRGIVAEAYGRLLDERADAEAERQEAEAERRRAVAARLCRSIGEMQECVNPDLLPYCDFSKVEVGDDPDKGRPYNRSVECMLPGCIPFSIGFRLSNSDPKRYVLGHYFVSIPVRVDEKYLEVRYSDKSVEGLSRVIGLARQGAIRLAELVTECERMKEEKRIANEEAQAAYEADQERERLHRLEIKDDQADKLAREMSPLIEALKEDPILRLFVKAVTMVGFERQVMREEIADLEKELEEVKSAIQL